MHNAFAHQLLKLRTEQQLSQTDIANLLFVSRQAVSKWENGDTEPNLDNLIALARILNVSLENLITGSSNPNSLLLTLSHVSKSFSKPVLKDVNLTVHSHERIANYRCILQNRSTQLCNIIIHSCVMKKAIV